nr:Verru_Chthon cassette protein A [Verrucomicrobiota bacterium]
MRLSSPAFAFAPGPRAKSTRNRPRGVALVVVLCFLVLLTALIVAFFSSVQTELTGARSYADGVTARQLSQTVTNVVMAQIRDATQTFQIPGTPGSGRLAWASQAGLIRTYGEDGKQVRAFKLYSALDMVDVAGGPAPGSDIADGWPGMPAHYTDLNSPVLVQEDTGLGQIRRADGRIYYADYPIVNPLANPVEGFAITAPPGYNGPAVPVPATYDPSIPPDPSSTGNPAPMPVAWIYVLQDGRLVAPDQSATATRTAKFPGTPGKPGPIRANPIVGRIAFWTDDETCKVNLNTASEGTYWDTPRVSTNEDRALAKYQPAQREFQRYPGHPAMASLAPVFFATSATLTPALTTEQREAIYALTPRVVGGGSTAGTAISSNALTADTDRLYASVDELNFNPSRQSQDAAANIAGDRLGRSRFFLTASSRAPEVTLFNTPRVAVWPTHRAEKDASGRALRTAYDNLIRFCASVGQSSADLPLLYSFQRGDSNSPTADWAAIPRNRELLRYLQRLSDQAEPGFGGKLVTKLGKQDRDQLLVEILDYIRSSNLYDDNLQPTRYPGLLDDHVQFTNGRSAAAQTHAWMGHGQVTPLRVPENLETTYPAEPDKTSLMGFGRFHTISEAGILFICCADGGTGQPGGVAGSNVEENKTLGGTLLTAGQQRIQMMLLFEWFSPSQGWTLLHPEFSFEVEQVGGNFSINGQPMVMDPTGKSMVDIHNSSLQAWGVHNWGGSNDYRGLFGERWVPARGVMPADRTTGRREYGLVSAPITIDSTDGVMNFSGPEKVLVRLYSGTSYAHPRQLVQTIELHFPPGQFPVPKLVESGTPWDVPGGINSGADPTAKENWWTFHSDGPGFDLSGADAFGRLVKTKQRPQQYAGTLIRPEDTLRTLVPYHGDYRLVAGSHYVPVGVFQPSSFYFDPGRGNAIKSHISG